jgi:adenylate kinase
MKISIPSDIIEKLNDGYFLIVKDDKNITAWRLKDGELQNRCKHKTGTTKWATIKYLILPMEAEYSFRKINEE